MSSRPRVQSARTLAVLVAAFERPRRCKPLSRGRRATWTSLGTNGPESNCRRFRRQHTMRIARIFAHRVELPAPGGELQVVGRQVRHDLRQHHRRRGDERGPRRLRGGLPAGAVLPAGLRRGRAGGATRTRPAPDRPRPAGTAHAQPPHGRGTEGPPLRQERDRRRLLGHSRTGDRPSGVRADGRPLRRRGAALPGHFPRIAGTDGRQRRGVSGRRLHAVPTQGRRRPRPGHRTHPPGAGDPSAVRPPRRGRQHRLDPARGDPRRPGRPRPGRVHRAAVPDVRGVPGGAAAVRPPVRPRREHRRASTCCCGRGRTWRWTSST